MTSQCSYLVTMTYTAIMTTPTWPIAGSKPAPSPLLLVQSFVNTWELDSGTDVLADDADAANAWLRDAGLEGQNTTATRDELERAREVREGIRALAARNAGQPAPAEEDGLKPLRAVLHRLKIELTLGPEGQLDVEPDPQSASRLDAGLTRLLLIIRDAERDGTWPRLKACGNDECRWVFYDRSHSRQGTWCEMATCGNVIKNRNLRARRSARAASPAH
jgi:predicted RNA-binding Zn ribbon-like protein